MSDIWTIKAALEWTEGYLERKGDDNPRLSAQWLLSEATGLSRIELYARFDQPLSLEEREVLRGYVSRRGTGEPLQYITGEVGFRHISIKVCPGVLIPRPETEVLVSEALALLPAAPRPRAHEDEELPAFVEEAQKSDRILGPEDALFSQAHDILSDEKSGVLEEVASKTAQEELALSTRQASVASLEKSELLVADLCTGSGCIACSIAYEHALVRVIATDIAPEAVSLARENIQILNLSDRVQVLRGDLGEEIHEELLGSFDLVVSNPPYVPTEVLRDIPREVADYEPALALDGGDDGLVVFRRLLTFCLAALRPQGAFAFELHETCLDEAASLAREVGFSEVNIIRDLADRPRVLTGRLV